MKQSGCVALINAFGLSNLLGEAREEIYNGFMPNVTTQEMIAEFSRLKREVESRREELAIELRAHDEALGHKHSAPVGEPSQLVSHLRIHPWGQKAHILQMLAAGPLSIEEMYQKLVSLGYKFRSVNPHHSVRVIVYGMRPRLGRVGHKFCLPGMGDQRTKGGKKRISPEGRRRMGRRGKRSNETSAAPSPPHRA